MYQRWDHYQYADQSLIDGTSNQWTGEALPDGITDGVKSEPPAHPETNARISKAFAYRHINTLFHPKERMCVSVADQSFEKRKDRPEMT